MTAKAQFPMTRVAIETSDIAMCDAVNSAVNERGRSLFGELTSPTNCAKTREAIEYYSDLGCADESVLTALSNIVKTDDWLKGAAIRALANLTSDTGLVADEALVERLVETAMTDSCYVYREATLKILWSARSQDSLRPVADGKLWSQVVLNDKHDGCRTAAIKGIIRTGCVQETIPALMLALENAPTRLTALRALRDARPTIQLLRAVQQIIVTQHEDEDCTKEAVEVIRVVVLHGTRRSKPWRRAVARSLAVVREFCTEQDFSDVMAAHASAISSNFENTRDAVRALIEEYLHWQGCESAKAYVHEIVSMRGDALHPLLSFLSVADDKERSLIAEVWGNTLGACIESFFKIVPGPHHC